METVQKRPIIISVICILGVLWSLVNFVFVFSPFVRKISEVAPPIFGIIVAAQFISFIGIWHMKRWGVHLYIIAFFTKQIFTIIIDDFDAMSLADLIISGLFMIFLLLFYKKMEEEL